MNIIQLILQIILQTRLIWVLTIAACLDYAIGDPWGWLHPVQVMGWAIARATQFSFKRLTSPFALRLAGSVVGLGLVVGSGLVGWAIVVAATRIHPLLGLAIDSILLASCFAARSLRSAAEGVLQPLGAGDLMTARQQLSRYVGRDTADLSAADILRAVLETVTENATDGVMAPLFYALAGAILAQVVLSDAGEAIVPSSLLFMAPLPLAYKASSTLDSMIGYRTAPYTYFGWFSARLDDILTWVPCRLLVLTLALLSGKPRSVLQLCWRDAPQDSSPNSGWSECVYAAILGVQLGGINYYRGIAKPKPLLGDAVHPITPERVHQALQLTRSGFLIWLGIGIMTLMVMIQWPLV